MFLTESVQEVINFKWDLVGRKWHMIGCISHMYYMGVIAVYIDIVYNKNLMTDENRINLQMQLLTGCIYPSVYDFTQMYKTGLSEYFSDNWNVMGSLYLLNSIAQIGLHLTLGPFVFYSKLAMTCVIMLSLAKTLFYFRIFDAFSTIIKMLTTVIKDLQIFMIFFMLLLFKFSLMLGVMGIGNLNFKDHKFLD